MIHGRRRRNQFVKLGGPPSLTFNDDTQIFWVQITTGSNSKWMPLELGNAWHIYEDCAGGIIIQTYQNKFR
jgi:hypothetical protein